MFTALIIVVCAVACVCGFVRAFFLNVPAYTGIVIYNLLTGKTRSRGPGLRFRIPLAERVNGEHSVKERMTSGKMDAETKDEVPVPLSFFLEWHPDPNQLDSFVGFEQADITNALIGRLKSIASIIIRKKEKFDDVYDGLGPIAEEILKGFTEAKDASGHTLQENYGIIVSAVRFSDPEVPEKIVQAKLDLEAQRKTNEKRQIEMDTTNELREKEMKMTNKLRGKEMTKLRSLATAWVKKAKEEHGQELDFHTALTIIQKQLGIIKQEDKNFGLNPDTLKVLQQILS